MQSGQVDYGAKFDCHVNDSLISPQDETGLWTFAGDVFWHKDVEKQTQQNVVIGFLPTPQT